MYTVTVRDHMMIAHSLPGEVFGPAQRMHGATYVVDATFRRPALDADGVVVDLGLAPRRRCTASLDRFRYRDLDDEPALAGVNDDDRGAGPARRRPTWPSGSATACSARPPAGSPGSASPCTSRTSRGPATSAQL